MGKVKNKKIAFLDRDGVINKNLAPHHYVTKIKEFQFNRGIFKLLHDLHGKGYEFIIVTNQRGIARKMFSKKALAAVHEFMLEELKKRDIHILDIFYCPHNLNACNCRKPQPGMLENACSKYAINIKKSILISDSKDDILMGEKFGLGKNYLVDTNKPKIML